MHIKKYDFNYGRRHFMEQASKGIFAAGVLMPVWDAVAENGELDAAYPDELLSIEEFTKGAMKPGDMVNADNVDLVQDILDPIRYQQVKQMGREIELVNTMTDMTQLSPVPYIEATLRNRGQATFDEKGNVYTKDGQPWIGGSPFPEPKDGFECFVNITMTWGRHDISFYQIKQYEISPQGEQTYFYQLHWVEFQPVGRVQIDPKPYWPGHEDMLRYQTVFWTLPQDIAGTSFLNSWYYDQSKMPGLIGYLPQFKRVRKFPASQRFEPFIPGSTLYLSDAWAAGDPYLTWGNYKIVGRGPFLAGASQNWTGEHENWEYNTHGGPNGISFWDTKAELMPDVIVVEAEPTGFPRAPVSKKRVWFDARTMLPINMVTYDRRGEPFKSFDGCYGLYDNGSRKVMDGDYPYWSWCNVHAHDIQSNRITRLEQCQKVGNYEMSVNDPTVYDNFLTKSALRRLGK